MREMPAPEAIAEINRDPLLRPPYGYTDLAYHWIRLPSGELEVWRWSEPELGDVPEDDYPASWMRFYDTDEITAGVAAALGYLYVAPVLPPDTSHEVPRDAR